MNDLRKKAERLHRVIEEQFYDDRGLLYAYLNIETRKPFTAAEVEGYPIKFPGAPPPREWFGYENTTVVAGNYLSALSHRARVEPGREVNAMIDRAMKCLGAVYDMSAADREPGWLCKPYGGKPSRESTNDQYGGDPNVRWMGATQWGLVTMAFLRAAYELTGDDRYARETERLCREEKCDSPPARSGSFLHEPFPDRPHIGVRRFSAYHFLVAEYLEVLCDTWPERLADWQRVMAEFWTKDIHMGLDDDGLQFACYEVDKRTNEWKPIGAQFLFPPGVTKENAGFLHHHWVGRFKSGSTTCHVASAAVKVGRCILARRDEARAVAWKILQSVDEHNMATSIDPEGNQESEVTGPVRKKMFDGRAPAQWLRAYWQGRDLGWWE